jgi:membrane protein
MPFKRTRALIQTTIKSWADDYAPSMGAALSYYTLFSVAPLLLIVIAVAGMAFGEDAARGEIFWQLRELVGEGGAAALQTLLESVNRPAEGIAASVVGFVLLGVGATSVFSELQDALDRIWRAPARDRSSGIIALLRARLLSFGLILCIGFLLIVSLVLSAAVAVLGKWSSTFIGWELLAQTINLLISFALTATIFAMIYKFMPRAHIQWKDVWIGAAATAMLLALGKLLIGIYIGKSGVVSGFGAAGSLVVVLMWVYYSAQLFLLGAEFTWVYAHTYGSRKHLDLPKVPPEQPSAATAQETRIAH